MTLTMYDAVNVAAIPAGAQAVACYVDGNWPTCQQVDARFPHAQHLTIAVHAGDDAECLDVETGDATPSEAAGWVNRQLGRGVQRPCVYANGNTWNNLGLARDLAGYGPRIRRWIAEWDNNPQIPAGYDAKQYSTGGNYDTSVCADNFFGPPAPPPDPHHYLWFYTGPWEVSGQKLNERQTVESYDKYRVSPTLHALALRKLRDQLGLLAGRVLTVAHEHPDPGGKPSWDQDHRGWRFQQLIHRAQGQRLA